MKKLASLLIAGVVLSTACTHKSAENATEDVPTTSDSLRVALANQDSLLSLMNDVAEGMAQIKQMENILSSTGNLTAESNDRRQQIRNDMQVIQQTLQMRRDRLAELEKKITGKLGQQFHPAEVNPNAEKSDCRPRRHNRIFAQRPRQCEHTHRKAHCQC